MIPYGRQDISDADIEAVIDVLRSDFLTQGPAVPAFEHAIAEYCGVRHAIAVNSATSALHIACLALDVGPGDLVWTSPISFVASANCALYCGADVDFVDIDSATANMSVSALEKKLAQAQLHGRLPKVIVPVHLAGTPCDMAAIRALGNQYGFSIIEDASHAIGARYLDAPVGACTYSDITVFSFHPVKIITTGEGGVATTQSTALAQRMELLRSHGVTRSPELMTREPDGAWYYEQIDLGFNYRMTDIQAALGKSQMERLNQFVNRRHEFAQWYDTNLEDLPVSNLARPGDSRSSLHLYVLLVDEANSRRRVFDSLRTQGISANVHYMPVYRQPYYEALGFARGHCPHAEDYYARAISLPLHPGLTTDDLESVRSALQRALT